MLERKEFRKKLREELSTRLTLDHPLIHEAAKPQKNLPLLRLMATQGYQLTKVFARYIGGLYFHCPPLPRHSARLAHNLYEEETGRISKTAGHLQLMQRFIYALGVEPDELEAVEPLPETKELIDYRMRWVSDPKNFHRGAAAVMIASEGQNLETQAGKMRHQMFPEVYGLTEKDLTFFTVHAAEDVYHVREGVELVSVVCTNEKTQAEAVQTIHETCDRFWWFYDGIERAYKSQQLSSSAAN
ncbi:MAG TPA: iron-containing redox enzyme family protein [Pyrinomonadaceae bacterium]|nr:iron-containing redox enzyme family protein [Pyrinomonadaceae bacterium]